MSSISLSFPSRIHYGLDILPELGALVRTVARRALIVTESAMHVEHHLERCVDSLQAAGVDTIVFEDIGPLVSTVVVNEATDLVRASKPQLVIGLGGMRVLAAARLAAHWGAPRGTASTAPFCIEIPTSCRNHSLFRNEAIITDSTTSQTTIVPLPARLLHSVVVDPSLTYSLSTRYFSVAILDTLLASIEGYLSDRAHFISDTYLEKAISTIGDSLGVLMRSSEDMQARNKACEAGLLSAMGLGTTCQGIGGAVSLVINSKHKVPKSWVSAVLLPHVLELYIEHHPVKLARIAQWLGEDVHGMHAESVAHKAVDVSRRIIGILKLPGRLRDLNLSLSDIGEIPELALNLPYAKTLPFRMDHDQVYELIKKAF